MEAESVEDNGDGVEFCIYAYNVQPGVVLDYKTGDSQASDVISENTAATDYVLNINSHKFHLPSCTSAQQMSAKNKEASWYTR